VNPESLGLLQKLKEGTKSIDFIIKENKFSDVTYL